MTNSELLTKATLALGDALTSKSTSRMQLFIETNFGSNIKKQYSKHKDTNNSLFLRKMNEILQNNDNEEDSKIEIKMPQFVSYLKANGLKDKTPAN